MFVVMFILMGVFSLLLMILFVGIGVVFGIIGYCM